MTVVLTIWFAVLGSFGAGAIAQAKKRDYLRWWLGGLLFSLPAVLLVSSLPAKAVQERC